MSDVTQVSGEKFDHKVAGIFESRSAAEAAADKVQNETDVRKNQIFVVGPDDPHPGAELEPESKGIWRTLLLSHLWLGLIGAVLGGVFFWILYAADVGFIVHNAMPAALLIVAFSFILGLMFAGLVTLRPDHAPYIMVSQSALRQGKYVVAVHARDRDQLRSAKAVLDREKVKTISSI
ncbi:hypothetical protein [Marinimicrobium alkaliphilum]|uniref:hypothetical protein n=1 Tax=Marinimicrobium alkaliphilum TaxID=2202654 RepID=UPI000DB90F0C|nr:hypothetical protein [Marinimicrobium alkaliphilum]